MRDVERGGVQAAAGAQGMRGIVNRWIVVNLCSPSYGRILLAGLGWLCACGPCSLAGPSIPAFSVCLHCPMMPAFTARPHVPSPPRMHACVHPPHLPHPLLACVQRSPFFTQLDGRVNSAHPETSLLVVGLQEIEMGGSSVAMAAAKDALSYRMQVLWFLGCVCVLGRVEWSWCLGQNLGCTPARQSPAA